MPNEKLDAENANYLELFQYGAGNLNSSVIDFFGNRRRRNGHIENLIQMLVVRWWKMSERSISSSRGDNRNLLLEIDEALKHSRAACDCVPGGVRIFGTTYEHLPFAVVAEARSLQNGRTAMLRNRPAQGIERVNRSQTA